MQPGGWSVGETLAHLLAWDRFALTERLPRMRPGAALPSAPDVEAFNARTAAHARADISRDALIAEFATVRGTLVAHLRALPAGSATMTFTIAGQQQTVQDYVEDAARTPANIRRRWTLSGVRRRRPAPRPLSAYPSRRASGPIVTPAPEL